jgi:hypothetical protein
LKRTAPTRGATTDEAEALSYAGAGIYTVETRVTGKQTSFSVNLM